MNLDPTTIVLILSNAAGVGLSVYLGISRRRVQKQKDELAVSRERHGLSAKERRDAAAEAWDYAERMENRHRQETQMQAAQIQAYRQELTELRVVEREGHGKCSSQAVQIRYQDDRIRQLLAEVEELKTTLAAGGLRDRSDVHQALPPDEAGQ